MSTPVLPKVLPGTEQAKPLFPYGVGVPAPVAQPLQANRDARFERDRGQTVPWGQIRARKKEPTFDPLPREQSERLKQIAIEAAKAKEAERLQLEKEARQREEQETRQAAAAAAASGYRGVKLTLLNRLPLRVQDRLYEDASTMLLPSSLRPGEAPSPYAKLNLAAFNNSTPAEVCDSVYGEPLRKQLAAQFSDPSKSPTIRDFFELDEPQKQCDAIVSKTGANQTHCWICGTTLGDTALGNKRECEHKLPILFAILITGLYDRRLHRVLIAKGLEAQYIALLKPEYAWAHQLCNQVKSDTPLVQLAFAGRGVKTVQANPSASNTATLLKGILESTGNYTPKSDELWRKLTTEDAQWNGQVADGARTGRWTGDKAGWIQSRTIPILGAMSETVKNFNSKGYTTDVLIASFVNSLWRRACFLAPEAVRSLRYDTLPEVYQRMVDDAFAVQIQKKGGRRRTRRKHRGGNLNEGDVWVYLAESLAKAIQLPRLRELILAHYSACESLPDSWMECVCEALSDYAKECEELAAKALFALDPDRFLDMRRPSQIVSEVIAQLIHTINPGWEEENLGVRKVDAGIPPVSSWNPPAVPGAMTDEDEKSPPAIPLANDAAAAVSSSSKKDEDMASLSPQRGNTGVLSFVTPDPSQRIGLPPSGLATLENSSVGTGASTPSSPFGANAAAVPFVKRLPTVSEEDAAFKEGGGFQIGPRPSWL